MAKLSLLDMTQNILSALDSDPVNSIDDTVESLQVVEIIKESYFEMMSLREWAHLRQLFNLVGLGDSNNPTKMLMPETANKILWLKYNKKEVSYMDPKAFKDMLDMREPLTGVVDANGFGMNGDPVYWTSYDDEYVTFDSYDSTSESSLLSAKAIAYGVVAPSWSSVDTFVPDIPEKFFPTLLAEAKAQAFVNLKQQQNGREEAKARRGRVAMQNEHWRTDDAELRYNRKVNYGRK